MFTIRKAYYPDEEEEEFDFIGCCGASYNLDPIEFCSFEPAGCGILVHDGIHGIEGVDGNIEVSHVRTKNGDITVVVQHEW